MQSRHEEGSDEQQLPHCTYDVQALSLCRQARQPRWAALLPISSWQCGKFISTMEACMYEGTPYCTVSLHLHFHTATGYSKTVTGYSKTATGYSKSRVNTSQLAFACYIDEDSSPTNSISIRTKSHVTRFTLSPTT